MVELRSLTQMRWTPLGVAVAEPWAPLPVETRVAKTGASPS